MKLVTSDFGCAVHGIDANTISLAEIDHLRQLLYKNRLLVLKSQSLDEAQYCAFAARFGLPEPYLQENYRHPDFPLIFVSSNVTQGERRIGVPRTGGYWHSDTSFEAEPKFITMLMPKVLPLKSPRTTRFIDMSKVYAELPQALMQKIEGQSFVHSGRWRYKVRPGDAGLDITELLQMIDHFAPPVSHPAVVEHPYTREGIVYGNRGFTVGIVGKSKDESNAILGELFDFAETDRFVREVRWEAGDLIIWDNRFLAHSSGRAKSPTESIHEEVRKEEETMMYRITLRDGMPLCRTQAANDSTAHEPRGVPKGEHHE